MTKRLFPRFCLLLIAAASLSSCAYMQTHKNVNESFRLQPGYTLEKPLALYKADGQYYLATKTEQLRKHYPTIYDSIFLNENNEPWYTAGEQKSSTAYWPISSGTAAVLQRKDGYAEISVLQAEIQQSSDTWVSTLPAGAQACTIEAEVTGQAVTWAANAPLKEIPAGVKVVSLLDRVLIDWPGTVLYNAAIPIMAPFVFFHQFITEE